MSRSLATGLTLLVVLVAPSAAGATWSSPGGGAQSAKARTMPAGATPTASVSNRSVTVSWSASTIGGSPVAGYVVKRYDNGGTLQTIGSACSGTVSATSCTETGVPGGTWRYSVTPKHSNWLGTEGSQSTAVSVASPSLTLTGSTTLTTLPGTLSGTLAAYIPGQTVTYRLDDPSTGTVLTATTTPSTIPAGGGATASITIPALTPNGSHTVYAIGSGGSDSASASFTVDVTYTVNTSAWDVRDASSGTENDVSAPIWLASDSLTFNTGNWPTAFSGTRYVDFDFDGPLPSGNSVSGASFSFRRAAGAAGDTACFYFEVRRASTNALLGTHGSSGSPFCVTGTTQLTVATSIPEVTTTADLDDLRIRIYGRESGARPMTIDLATITGTAPVPFTLQGRSYTDATSGTPTTSPWSLYALDGTYLESGSNWANAFGASRYLKLGFPAYVPSGATIKAVTLRHAYRPTTSGRTACYYAEVYAGTTLIGTHGNGTGSPISCNATTSFTTDAVVLPEVNTPTRANSLFVRLYFTVTGSNNRLTRHDRVSLQIDYGQ